MFVNPSSAGATKAWEDSLEHRLLEEELDLQLAMLRDHDKDKLHPGPGLFPEVEPPYVPQPRYTLAG